MLQQERQWSETSGKTNKQKKRGEQERVAEGEKDVTLREALKGVRHQPLGSLPDDLALSDMERDAKYFDTEQLIRLLTKKMNLSDKKVQEVLAVRGGKTKRHIIRMLDPSRSMTERNFADWFSREYDSIDGNFVRDDRELEEVIGGEGVETMVFWTMAPYLLKKKQKKGKEEKKYILPHDAMYLVFDWLKQGIKQNEGENFRLIGLDDMLEEYRKINPDDERFHSLKFFLPRDSSHLFHKYIQQLARKVVENVIYPRYLELQDN